MRTVEVIVEHAGNNLSAYIEGAPVITVGNNIREIEDNMKEAIDLYLEDNPNPCEILKGEFSLKFKIDASTFIMHKPRKQQLEKIQKGINALTEELAAINLL